MAGFDLVLRGGRVAIGGGWSACDVAVAGGRIAALGLDLPAGREEIDLDGRYVTPGGVDAHCHIDQPSGDGSICADDFLSATVSAACGGTTTVIPFAAQAKGQSLRAAVEDYHRRAEGRATVDYAFHLIVSDPTPQVLGQELPALIRDGCTSLKIYMTYDDLKLADRQVLDVLAVARREGAMTMVHAENADCIAWLTERLELAGRTAPRFHATSRPGVVEGEATHRAIALSRVVDAPVLLVHVSAKEAVEQIRWAQGLGLKVFAETCPHYLFLTEEDLARPGFEGAKCICSPPPRDRANQQVIWDGLRNGAFQVFSSDHAPTRYDDPKGKKIRGETASFRWVPNGVPGLETRMPLLFSEGVLAGRLDIARFVDLTAAAPARIYGLWGRKGAVAPGFDADLVVWDEKDIVVTNAMLHHNVDYTPYEGMRLKAWPWITFSRGEAVWRDGVVDATPGRGRFLACEISEAASPLGRGGADIQGR
jgi:dihydropyrimidinase